MSTRTDESNTSRGSDVREHEATPLPLGVGIGLAVGVILGIVMDNIALGMAVGLAIGCGWALSAATLSRSHSHERRPRRRFDDHH